jgi:hypothetical protein
MNALSLKRISLLLGKNNHSNSLRALDQCTLQFISAYISTLGQRTLQFDRNTCGCLLDTVNDRWWSSFGNTPTAVAVVQSVRQDPLPLPASVHTMTNIAQHEAWAQ